MAGYNARVNTSQRQITRAAGTVMAAFILSNVVGLVRQILIAHYFGTGDQLDAYYAAARVPDILFNLVAGGALASAFVPTFTGFLTHEDRAGAWRLASSVMNLAFLILAVTSLLAALGAEPLVRFVLARGFANRPEQVALTVSLLRILLLTSTIFGMSGLVMGILNAHQHFLLPALASTFYWLGMIFGLLVWTRSYGIYGLAWGAVLGAGLHLLIQLPGLRGLKPRYWPRLELRNPAVREVIRLMGPRLISVAAVQVNFLVTTALASYLAGGVSALSYAFQIFTMPQVVIAQAISIAALPTFSALVARGEIAGLRASFVDTLRGILFLALPATVGLMLLSRPVVALFFQSQSGIFNAQSTSLVAWALACYTLGLVSHSVVEITPRAFFALHDTRTPVIVSTAAMTLNVGLSFAFRALFVAWGWPPHAGLAFSLTVATTLEMTGLVWLLRRQLGGLDVARLWPGLWRTVLASAIMGAAVAAWLALASAWPEWLVAVGGVAGGGGVFAAAAYALGCPEARLFPAKAVARLRGQRPQAVPPA
jgi:putative peptidoglycan lipid II flippase